MSWEIVTGIIALIGVFSVVATWSGKLTRTLTGLEATIKSLNRVLEELKENNREAHKEFYDKLEDHEERLLLLEDHEKRNEKNIPPRQSGF